MRSVNRRKAEPVAEAPLCASHGMSHEPLCRGCRAYAATLRTPEEHEADSAARSNSAVVADLLELRAEDDRALRLVLSHGAFCTCGVCEDHSPRVAEVIEELEALACGYTPEDALRAENETLRASVLRLTRKIDDQRAALAARTFDRDDARAERNEARAERTLAMRERDDLATRVEFFEALTRRLRRDLQAARESACDDIERAEDTHEEAELDAFKGKGT